MQVIGGRWKPLHYFYKQSVFADVMAACGGDGTCYIKNDSPMAFTGQLTIASLEFATGSSTVLYNQAVSLATGAGVTQFFSVDLSSVTGSTHLLTAVVRNSTAVVSNNVILLAIPSQLSLPAATVTAQAASTANPDGSVDVTVTTNQVALYVVLTTAAQGRFSDNAFLALPGTTVSLEPVESCRGREGPGQKRC